MIVHIDLLHPAHVNLFKKLVNDNFSEFEFIVTCIDRGKLFNIAKDEIRNVPIYQIGKHRGTKTSILIEANFLRFFQLLFFLINKKIDIGISFGSFLAGAVLRLKGKPYIHLSDDPERKVNAILENLTCTERYLPPIVDEKGKVKTFNALKEWSYLSPSYLRPSTNILKDYGLLPKNYIFIREVSTGSLNYLNQEKNLIASVAHQIPKDFSVVFSLEDKSMRHHYPESWILLNEPVKDIHSLIYFSSLMISSGDSMAREGAMLGVPSIYCGFREMKANNILIERKMLFKTLPQNIGKLAKRIISKEIDIKDQKDFRLNLKEEWADVNSFLYWVIKNHTNTT